MGKWQVITTDDFDAWFAEQSEPVQIEISAAVQMLAVVGPMLGRPWADTLKGSRHANLKELRVAAEKQVIRIAFAFDPDRLAVLLTAGAKQGKNEDRFYKALILKAETLYAEHLANRQKKDR